MGKRARKKLILIISMILAVVITFVIGFFVVKEVYADTYEQQIRYYEETMQENSITIYRAAVDIMAGEEIKAEMLETQSALFGITEQLFTSDDIGGVALVDIPQGSVMYRPYLSKDATKDGVWLTEYSCFGLSSNMRTGNYIDIRIRYPKTGEDYVVLSKKYIKDISYAAATCFLYVNEEETHLMASAIYDANEYSAVLYAVLYVNPSVQEATVVDYVPTLYSAKRIWGERINESTVDINEAAPYNYVIRKDLEKRVSGTLTGGDISNVTVNNTGEISNVNGKGAETTSGYDEDDRSME